MTTKVNVLELNICGLQCQCGWNIKIGSKDYELLGKLVKFLRENGELVDLTNRHAVEMLLKYEANYRGS